MSREPCDRCRLIHGGRPCYGPKRRISASIPESLVASLNKQVPEGQRSVLITRLLDNHFNPDNQEGTP